MCGKTGELCVLGNNDLPSTNDKNRKEYTLNHVIVSTCRTHAVLEGQNQVQWRIRYSPHLQPAIVPFLPFLSPKTWKRTSTVPFGGLQYRIFSAPASQLTYSFTKLFGYVMSLNYRSFFDSRALAAVAKRPSKFGTVWALYRIRYCTCSPSDVTRRFCHLRDAFSSTDLMPVSGALMKGQKKSFWGIKKRKTLTTRWRFSCTTFLSIAFTLLRSPDLVSRARRQVSLI